MNLPWRSWVCLVREPVDAFDLHLGFGELHQPGVLRVAGLGADGDVDVAVAAEDRESHAGLGACLGTLPVIESRHASSVTVHIDHLPDELGLGAVLPPGVGLRRQREGHENQDGSRSEGSIQHWGLLGVYWAP